MPLITQTFLCWPFLSFYWDIFDLENGFSPVVEPLSSAL